MPRPCRACGEARACPQAAVHYTQDLDRRWEGISKNRRAHLGEFPAYSDCSSFATWCLWNGLFLLFRLPDTVNGLKWKAGNTTSMRDHGMHVQHEESLQRGDCVFYSNTPHVAIVVSRTGGRHGEPMVVSHGSEAGPFHIEYNYRTPTGMRRYI
jgi:hypothetical protein